MTAEYQRVHKWIRKQMGKASRCDFNISHTGRFHWSNISGKYLYDLTDWQQLCPSCHKKYDMTDRVRENIGRSKLGNTCRSLSVICLDTGKRYSSGREAARSLGILATSINNCLRGLSKTAGGYRWTYGRK